MAAIEAAAFTTPTVEGITRQELMKRFLRRTGFGEYGIIDDITASTTALTDSALIGAGLTTKSFVGGFCRIVKNANSAGNAPEGEVRPVSAFTPSTGAFTTAAFSANVDDNDEYEIWRQMRPQLVLDWLDECLTEDIYYPCYTLLTEVPDGDMEQTGVTDWETSNCTISKAGAPDYSGVGMYGKRFLDMEATDDNAYTSTKSIHVAPGKGYHMSVLTRASTEETTLSPVQLQAWDVTNDVLIDSVSTELMFMHRIYKEFNVPADCNTIGLRLVIELNTSKAHFDELCLYQQGANEIRLPWWVKAKNQLLKVWRLEANQLDTQVWDAGLRGVIDNTWEVQDRYYGDGGLKLVSRTGNIGQPLYIAGLRNETAYENDYTEEKLVNVETVLAGLLYKAFLYMGTSYVSNQADMAKYLSLAGIWEARYKKAKYTDMERMQQILTAPSRRVYHLDPRHQYSA